MLRHQKDVPVSGGDQKEGQFQGATKRMCQFQGATVLENPPASFRGGGGSRGSSVLRIPQKNCLRLELFKGDS